MCCTGVECVVICSGVDDVGWDKCQDGVCVVVCGGMRWSINETRFVPTDMFT